MKEESEIEKGRCNIKRLIMESENAVIGVQRNNTTHG
jgi:hypothetical protein